MDHFDYSLFGLSFRSNFSIPVLKSLAASSASPQVEIRFGDKPRLDPTETAPSRSLIFASSTKVESGEPALRIWHVSNGALVHLEYEDGMNFWLDREGKNIWAKWPETSTLADAVSYLLGPVLGLLLRLRGIVCLHASAVAFEDYAVVFAGGDGAGKSTTAAAFAYRGHAVLSDDVVALVERDNLFYVMPAYPYISLWPDSVEMLYGPGENLPSFSQNFEKRRLALDAGGLHFEGQPLRVGAIFILGERTSDEAAPFVETMTPKESLISLVANSYAAHLVDKVTRASEFEFLGRLVSSVPMGRLRPHADPARLHHLCDLVRKARGLPLTDPT